jgi:hypothetical protein
MEDVQREYQDISESVRKSLWKPLSKRANGFVHSFRKTLEEQPIQVSKTEPEAPTLDTSTMSNDERIENLHRQHEGLLKEVQELTSQLERAEAWANRLTTM